MMGNALIFQIYRIGVSDDSSIYSIRCVVENIILESIIQVGS